MSTTTQVETREMLVSTNPATGEKLGELACATPEEVHEAVRRARQAQPAWQALPVKKRVAARNSSEGAAALASEAIPNSVTLISSSGLRPKRSEK